MICRRASKCEPLLRFNPLNLVDQRGLVCFLGFSIEKSVDDSNLYYFKDKGSIEITSKLEALGRALLSGAIG